MAFYFFFLSLHIKISQIKKESSIERELPIFLNNMMYSLKTGITPISFLSNYSETKTALSVPIKNLIRRIHAGCTPVESCKNIESSSLLLHYTLNLVAISLKAGGGLTGALENIKNSSISHIKLKRFITSRTIQLRLQAYIITIIPLIIGGILFLLHPETIKDVLAHGNRLKILFSALIIQFTGILIVHKSIRSPMKHSSGEGIIYFLELLSILMGSGKNSVSAIKYMEGINMPGNLNDLIKTLSESYRNRPFKEFLDSMKPYFPEKIREHIFFIFKENFFHGVPAKKIFEEMAQELRRELMSEITIKIEKLPVKLLFPLMFLIAPSTMIIIFLFVIPF